jgi:hypothetical protein
MYMLRKKRTMKMADDMKKKLVLKKGEPRIGYPSGQKGEVQPTAKTMAAIVLRTEASINRLRSERLDNIILT